MIFKDYYKILEINSPQVTTEQIKAAYREQAKKYHPDVNIGNTFSEERFKDINEAYNVLSNKETKRKYDRMWNSKVGKRQKKKNREKLTIKQQIWQMFFGTIGKVEKKKKENKESVRGEDIETQISVSIEEAFFGAEKKLTFRTVDGKTRTFQIKIPAGIRNQEKIRLIGQGKNGKNGGRNGDLFIKIDIQDSKEYKLKGYDLVKVVPLSPWEAALGTKLKIKTIEDEITVIIPEGTQTDQKIKISNKGYKRQGERGDLLLQIKIRIPETLSKEEKDLFKQLEKVSKYQPRMVNIKQKY